MLIAAALIELALPEAGSLKDKRRVVRSVKDRLRSRFNVAVAEIADQDDHQSICLGLCSVGNDPRHLRERLAKALRFVESLGLAELIGDDIVVARIDELQPEEIDDDESHPGDGLPDSWRDE